MTMMKESYNIFKELLGADDKNTKEAEYWYEQLTQNAVAIAKQNKLADEKREKLARANLRFGPGLGSIAQPAPAPARPGVKRPDERSVDELLRYIEGTDKTNGSGSGGKKRTNRGKTNPKRRSSNVVKPTSA
jgi:protein TIF31